MSGPTSLLTSEEGLAIVRSACVELGLPEDLVLDAIRLKQERTGDRDRRLLFARLDELLADKG